MESPACFVCSLTATTRCDGCRVVHYCGDACSAAHRAAHAEACARAAARRAEQLPAASCAAELAAIRADLIDLGISEHTTLLRVVIMGLRNVGSMPIPTIDVETLPLLGDLGAHVVSLGIRARSAGDRQLANLLFIIASGAIVAAETGEAETNVEADFNRAVEYVELGGGGTGAGVNTSALSAGLYWATRAHRCGHTGADALGEWSHAERLRVFHVERERRLARN
jgi:hypothetical protein